MAQATATINVIEVVRCECQIEYCTGFVFREETSTRRLHVNKKSALDPLGRIKPIRRISLTSAIFELAKQ